MSAKRARRRRRSRWRHTGGLVLGPFFGPSATTGAVFIVEERKGRYGVAGVASPEAVMGAGAQAFFDDHAHAVIAEGVPLAKAKRLGEEWARKFRKGLVLAPCACEDMVEKVAYTPLPVSEAIARVGGGPRPWAAPVGSPIGLLPPSGSSAPTFKATRLHATSPHDDPAPSGVQVQRGGVWLSAKEAAILDRRFGRGAPEPLEADGP